MKVREYEEKDIGQMIQIWNEVVEEGNAFPQEDFLDTKTGLLFFKSQTYCGVAVDENNNVLGLYILHPNNIGRCGHICNASYAVRRSLRGCHIGELLVKDCMKQGKLHGFKVLQFNAVVASNLHARHLYERLGFIPLGIIKNGFRMKDGSYEDICPYYIELYDKFTEINPVDQAIFESEKEIANGAEAVDAEIVFAELEKKYFE